MELLPVFVDSSYQIRSGWRFLAYCVLLVGMFFMTQLAASIVVGWLYPELFESPRTDIRYLAVNAIVLFIPSAGTLFIMARGLDQTPVSVFGVALHDRWAKDFAWGLAIAAGMLSLTLAGSFLFGEVRLEWTGSLSAIRIIGFTLAVFALSAINEELVFRGYPLQVLMKGLGPWGSMILISSLFGLLHWRNPGATVLSVLNTILAGVLLALAYLKTRSLWFPYGIHLGWNAGLSVVLGYPVSGIPTASILTTHVSGSQTMLGGSYGPEAGIVGTVIFVAGAVVVRRMRTVRVSPQMRTALAAHAEKTYVEAT